MKEINSLLKIIIGLFIFLFCTLILIFVVGGVFVVIGVLSIIIVILSVIFILIFQKLDVTSKYYSDYVESGIDKTREILKSKGIAWRFISGEKTKNITYELELMETTKDYDREAIVKMCSLLYYMLDGMKMSYKMTHINQTTDKSALEYIANKDFWIHYLKAQKAKRIILIIKWKSIDGDFKYVGEFMPIKGLSKNQEIDNPYDIKTRLTYRFTKDGKQLDL